MSNKLPQRDPIGIYQRDNAVARRVGKNKHCACGEARPEALIPKSNPTMCAACQRKNQGKTTMDNHHVAGEANSPVTVLVPVNDHRADLSLTQYNWPKKTLENPGGSPELAAAAGIRGFADTNLYLIEKLLLP